MKGCFWRRGRSKTFISQPKLIPSPPHLHCPSSFPLAVLMTAHEEQMYEGTMYDGDLQSSNLNLRPFIQSSGRGQQKHQSKLEEVFFRISNWIQTSMLGPDLQYFGRAVLELTSSSLYFGLLESSFVRLKKIKKLKKHGQQQRGTVTSTTVTVIVISLLSCLSVVLATAVPLTHHRLTKVMNFGENCLSSELLSCGGSPFTTCVSWSKTLFHFG